MPEGARCSWRRFALHFYGASDEGIFPEEVLAARLEREAASLAAWRRTAASFTDLASVHHWLHQKHMCYAIPRQVTPACFNGCHHSSHVNA